MGQKLTEKRKRDYLIEIISSYLKTNVALMQYFHASATDRKGKFACNKSLKQTEHALVHLRQIKHIELLDYLYSSFIGNNVIAYSISGALVLSKKLQYYDTDNGFVEFQQMLKEKKEQQELKEQERIKTEEAIKKAKAEGKKVEMVWDKESKTTKPLIVESKDN